MSRTKDRRRTNGSMGTTEGFWSAVGKVFTKENIQTGVQVVQQATSKNPGTVSYNGTDANVTGQKDFLNYFLIGGVGLAAIYFFSHKDKK
jgi:hypothetical protein